ncbi:MAG TPA: hypothetical protein VJA85_06950 [Candidatus Limnocylindria bacterium]|nr:hypothetical protein [Candidatus Limnocylindria bacterium]
MRRYRYLALTAIAGLLAACGGASVAPSTAATGGSVDATLTEWTMVLSASSGNAGEFTFNIANDGEKTHEFVVVSTDLAHDALPVIDDVVPEDQLTPVDEVEDILAGADGELVVTLEAGNYVILCNLDTHYEKGMHAAFTVN